MLSDVTIPNEIFALITALVGVSFAAVLSALGWLVLKVAKLGEDLAVIKQRLRDLPCDNCSTN